MGIDSFKDGTYGSRMGGGRPGNDQSVSERQLKILTGMMASDSSLGKQSYGNPFIITHMTNPIYLSWLDKQLGQLSTGVEDSTAAVSDWSKKQRYTLRSIRHPEFSMFDWVNEEGVKIIPESIDFTPLVAKVWYAGDGCLMWDSRYNSVHAAITSTTKHNREVLKDKLSNIRISSSEGIEDFKTDTLSPVINGNRVDILAGQTEEFLSWLGDPVPGYGYKWEIDSYESYLKKKDLMG